MNLFLFFILYLLGINVISFIIMGLDKSFAIKHTSRISEKTLFTLAFAFGGIGVLFGMYTFRHKTKHLSFKVLVPISIIVNISLCIYIIQKLH